MMVRSRGLSRYVQRGLSGRRGLGDGSGEVAVENAYSPDLTTGLTPTPGSILSTSPSTSSSINWNNIISNIFSSGTKLGQQALLPTGASFLPSGAIISPYGAAGGLLTSSGTGSLNIGTIFLYGAILIGGIAVISALGKK